MNLQKFKPIGYLLYRATIYVRNMLAPVRTIVVGHPKASDKLRLHLYAGLSWGMWWSTKEELSQDKDGIAGILKQADELFESSNYEACYRLLNELDNSEKTVDVQWRISRALYNMSKEPKYDEETRKLFVDQAFSVVANLLPSNWNNFAVHKWYALLLDAKSSHEGLKERIRQLENVKKHMDLAVTLNPEDATTLYMLGEWCYQITEMPWHQRKIAEVLFAAPPESTYEDALEYFLKAEAVQPRFYSLNLLRLGKCYLKLQKEDQAKYYLKLAASYPAKSNDDLRANKEATELLKKLKA